MEGGAPRLGKGITGALPHRSSAGRGRGRTLVLAFGVALAGAGILFIPLFLSGATVYVSLVAIGLALALQKYIASFAAYFLIMFGRIINVGNRVRIGNLKGDVKRLGLFHFVLEEVGEDEKLGGELTGRLLHVPNLIILDQPVLNYSKDYSVLDVAISSDYVFDEIRIPLALGSDIARACSLLESILVERDWTYVEEAKRLFRNNYPEFLNEAQHGKRVQVHVEPQRLWLKGKFVTPIRERNNLRTQLLLEFLERVKGSADIRLA
ncbi:MAG: mechanosensitive ion channel [Chloroflexi bacterium]|nr:mechanosensitive ion channel [Chloroflexota bacterium]